MIVQWKRFFYLFLVFVVAACGDDTTSNSSSPDAGEIDGGETCEVEEPCVNLECGADPVCGLDCGTCDGGQSCDEGICVCVPDCDGRACGPDGCGGTCGTCGAGEDCNEVSGMCAESCTPATCEDADVECGPTPDGCGQMLACGSCNDGTCEAGVCTSEPTTFSFVEPMNARAAREAFEIRWTDEDPDSDAEIAFYWDDDNADADGTLIVDGISEDDETDAYSWDVSMLPRGEYWIYAVMTDGINRQTVYAPASVFVDTVICEAPVMGKFAVDIDVADVTLTVTLNGQPVDATNTSSEDHGRIYLTRESEGLYSLGDVWDGQAPQGTFDVTLPTGVYEVRYIRNSDEPGNWPVNNAPLGTVELVDGADITVDIETVEVDLDWTLNGTTYAGTASETAQIRFQGTSLNGDSSSGSFSLDTTQTGTRTWNVIPGNFEAFYLPNTVPAPPSTVLPVNWGALGTFDFTTDTTTTVDLQVVSQTIDADLNGTAWATKLAGVTSPQEVTFALYRDADPDGCNGGCLGRDRIIVLDSTGVLLPATYTIFPGDFSVGLRHTRTSLHPELPLSGKVSDLVNLSGSPVTLDARSKTFDIDITVNGITYPSGPGSITIELQDRPYATGLRSGIQPSFTVFESVYTVIYSSISLTPGSTNFPTATQASIGVIDATTSSAATIDIPTTRYTIEAQLEGMPVTSANTEDSVLIYVNALPVTSIMNLLYSYELWRPHERATLDRNYISGDLRFEYISGYRSGSDWPTSWVRPIPVPSPTGPNIMFNIEGAAVEFVPSENGVPSDPNGPVPQLVVISKTIDRHAWNIHEPDTVGGWAPLQPRLFEDSYWVGVRMSDYLNGAFNSSPVFVGCVDVAVP